MDTTTTMPPQNDAQAPTGASPQPHRRPGVVGAFFSVLSQLIRRLAHPRTKSTVSQPKTFGGMTYDQLGQFAAANPPPQSWHDQDVTGLRGPAR
jgi:hypothetical protein